jgi:glycogen(starch) synthase
MKILLIGPYPPPYGGVSVHVSEARKLLHLSGVDCHVLNVDPHALASSEYLSIRSGWDFCRTMTRFARNGWILHVHTNGHNHRSWLVALAAGIAGTLGPGSLLTLHSGMAPAYLAPGRRGPRLLARLVCVLYRRIVAVAPEIRDAILSLWVPARRVALLPAFLPTATSRQELRELKAVEGRKPRLATTLFFRPEYGFELLVEAVGRVKDEHPDIACVVMGGGGDQEQGERLVHEKSLQRHFLFLGDVPHEKCISVMSRCDLFVRPTLADGDASSVREAHSLGIPVVASNVGHRPPGTTLFNTGDADDLAAKIRATISQPRPRPDCSTTEDYFQNLMDLYAALRKAPLRVEGSEQWEI